MLDKAITTLLFDLDGTLLPMELKSFTDAYFKLLAAKAAPYGYEPKALVAAVWKGTKAMIQNDGSRPNERRFWEVFAGELGDKILELRPVFDKFYAEEFNGAKTATRGNPLARKAVEGAKAAGYTVILATNPLFPAVGVATRLGWLGLSPEDFSCVTSYENCSYCKPNPMYYTQLLNQAGKSPSECLMVGNDVREDAFAAMEAGLSAYLITDCLENTDNDDFSSIPHGSFAGFMKFAGLE
ncbi:MAG: HAD family hydrolase [Acutalibacter sp.]|uniref:HAD family hydrolase n=1 Tax=Acutalibacter sp. TaxID=1918636 RepID=UPI0021728FFA|nr:HAD family hydrolase [Acutalibacter sp.]MCI9225101.1 HAD family hydrolase [Acutalibacter sp.]